MTATLRFKLPEETTEHYLAVNAGKMAAVIWELDQKLRDKLKYECDLDGATVKALEWVREKIRELASDEGLDLEIVLG